MAMCFLKISGTDPLEKQLGPIASSGMSVRPFVKYAVTERIKKTFLTGSSHETFVWLLTRNVSEYKTYT